MMKMKGLLKIACIVPAVVMAVASGAQSPSAGHKGIVPAGDAFWSSFRNGIPC